MYPSDAVTIINLLKERVRRITWIEKSGTEEFLEIHRIARMCYEMADEDLHPDGFPTLSNLSKEDVGILYALDSHKVRWFVNTINAFRSGVRPAGPVGPVEADLVAKDFVDIMTG
ncbi:hypothetical protein LCGC14_1436120 [marine sediment metagenome]|uniref:Uncharacterized protein n=1 Tax=marine sediment metagenome TaxID=412755 RepID=A0A0F9M2N4_9ZZZZ